MVFFHFGNYLHFFEDLLDFASLPASQFLAFEEVLEEVSLPTSAFEQFLQAFSFFLPNIVYLPFFKEYFLVNYIVIKKTIFIQK